MTLKSRPQGREERHVRMNSLELARVEQSLEKIYHNESLVLAQATVTEEVQFFGVCRHVVDNTVVE
jgi:hypothetical protein